jgi:general stress protein CsbA
MSLVDCGIVFGSAFFLVGLLGMQSKNVQHSKYVAAAITSMLISVSNFVKYAVSGGLIVLLLTAVGGACGVVTSIYLHDHHLMKDDDERN